jgi:leucyl aminopeptidase
LEVKVVAGDIMKIPAGVIIVSFFEEAKKPEGTTASVDKVLGGVISSLIHRGEIKGKLNEITLIHCLGKLPAEKVAVVGLGKKTELTLERVRGAVAEAARWLRAKGVDDIATVVLGTEVNEIAATDAVQAITEGVYLGLYAFRKHLTKPPEGEIKQVTILADANSRTVLQQSCRTGRVMAEAANTARDMVNEPSNFMTPSDMAAAAKKLAKAHKLELTILEREQMKKLGMGAILGVAQGSDEPPKFIVLSYKGRPSKEIDIALVGKGITFDSGGISIKPSDGMGDMKGDMAGGASVIAAIGAIAQLKPKSNVMVVVAATENMPSGHAFKPGDVLTAMNGKTIEIISTDAEGRLTLADALAYAVKQGARRVVDIATLTGSMRVALGTICTGTFSNNKDLEDRLIAAGAGAGERFWAMPMYAEYKEQNKSEVADIQNTGGRYAGSITAAQFLAEFVGNTPWVHLDIAGTSSSEKDRGYIVKGATGLPVRTLINLVVALAEQGEDRNKRRVPEKKGAK